MFICVYTFGNSYKYNARVICVLNTDTDVVYCLNTSEIKTFPYFDEIQGIKLSRSGSILAEPQDYDDITVINDKLYISKPFRFVGETFDLKVIYTSSYTFTSYEIIFRENPQNYKIDELIELEKSDKIAPQYFTYIKPDTINMKPQTMKNSPKQAKLSDDIVGRMKYDFKALNVILDGQLQNASLLLRNNLVGKQQILDLSKLPIHKCICASILISNYAIDIKKLVFFKTNLKYLMHLTNMLTTVKDTPVKIDYIDFSKCYNDVDSRLLEIPYNIFTINLMEQHHSIIIVPHGATTFKKLLLRDNKGLKDIGLVKEDELDNIFAKMILLQKNEFHFLCELAE